MRINKLFCFVMLPVAAIVSIAAVHGPSSSGSPASHTGAPGEATCAVSGCHDDNGLNSGAARLTVDMGSVESYVPGKTYTITVRITDPEVLRFGFQIVALSNIDNRSIGKFKLTDTKRTQFMPNPVAFSDREYVTYTFEGTDAIAKGTGEWTVNWKAPSDHSGPITFYVAGVSANDNENDKGDFVYTSSLIINDSH